MSTSVLVLKASVGAVALGGAAASVAIAALTNTPTQSITPKKPSSVVVVNAAAGTISQPTSLTVGSAPKNYQCRLLGEVADSVACNLVKLNIENNWIDLGGIKKATQTEAISAEELKNPTNYFRLDVDATLFSKINLATAKTIELVSTEAKPITLARLDTLFKLDGSTVEYEQTNYLLGKANANASAITGSQNYQCFTTALTASDTSKACQLYPFGSSTASLTGAGYSNQIPSNLPGTAVASALTAHQYYLIHHTTPQKQSELANLTTITVYENATQLTEKSGLNNVVPVILHGEVSAQKAFILSATPTYSVVVEKASAPEAPKTLTYNQTTKSYQCKLASEEETAVNCTLVPLGFAAEKTSLTLTDVKGAAVAETLVINTSDSTPTYYKLEVDSTFFSKFASTPLESESIQVIEKPTGTEAKTVLLTLNPLFTIGDDDAVNFDKSNFIISGSSLTASVSLTSGKERLCSFSENGSADSTPKKCHISDLNATIAGAQDFKKPTDEASTMVTANSYLVHFTEEPNEGGVDKHTTTTNTKFYLQETQDTSTKTELANFDLAQVDSAILVDSPTSGSKYAFILKN